MRLSSTNYTNLRKNKIFLNRNLYYNVKGGEKKDGNISDYYLHFLSKKLTKKEMTHFLNKFILSRCKSNNMEELAIVTKSNFLGISPDEDKDYFVDFLGCVLCKEELKTFVALFCHMKLNHSVSNAITKLKEGHLIAFPSKKQDIEGIYERSNSNFYFIKNEQKLLDSVISMLNSSDISQMEEVQVSKPKENNTGSVSSKNTENPSGFFKYYPDDHCDSRVFFHSVTGEIMTDIPEEEMYEIDSDDLREFDERAIDQFTDVCEKDKTFFKLWNRFIKTKDKAYCYMERILSDFIQTCGMEIISNNLRENFLLHLISLHDFQQIDKGIFSNIIRQFEKFQEEHGIIKANGQSKDITASNNNIGNTCSNNNNNIKGNSGKINLCD